MVNMNDCIFCKIIHKEIEHYIIYEDEVCIAFPDKHPINEGHVLLIPKLHEPDWWKLDDATTRHLTDVAKRLATIIDDVYTPKKVSLGIYGFDVPHTHLHVVPMHDTKDIVPGWMLGGTQTIASDDDMRHVAEMIKEKL